MVHPTLRSDLNTGTITVDFLSNFKMKVSQTMTDHNVNGIIKILGIDLAEQSFQLHGIDENGQVVLRKKLSRCKLSAFMANLPSCLIGLEACGGAHYWVRVFKAMGHDVRIIAPQFVKPYVKSNKNDSVDAEAICEAVQRPTMRFVPAKSVEQQDIQSLYRIRSQLVARRTAQSNQIRGLILEYGIVVPQGISYIRKGHTTNP
jgi:transposase